MFSRALNQYSELKRPLFCENQCIFVVGLPIKIFYFEDFRWSFFGKIIGQKQLLPYPSSSRKFHSISSVVETKENRDVFTKNPLSSIKRLLPEE
ncbi:hypothetical protein [Hoylesella timonensis]|uniref:hypothetical protein n=1 Tax=Hoylesella timonensis TaxID=386414 RepID=UPI0011AEF965|nr:hypothetical protein [Hoylesella timonensis]